MQHQGVSPSQGPSQFSQPRVRTVGYVSSGTMQEFQALHKCITSSSDHCYDSGTRTSPGPTLFISHELAPERLGVN